jgi:type I restriction-modification system DNA methylase subunit
MIERLFKQGFFDADLDKIDRQVNHLLNQIIFVRVAEDRQFGETPHLLETFYRWLEIGRKSGMFLSQLRILVGEYAQRYKVDLFSNGELLETEHLEDLISQLVYSLHSPGFPTVKYDFSVIDVDILGTMYEQYLRLRPQQKPKVIARQARLVGEAPVTELVPSDRAVGIHYTPSYIVDYIVGSSMRRWRTRTSDGKRPQVLDMACGSGSFLLAAYRWLLEEAEKSKSASLTRLEKQELLTECIWGIDKDAQAVEICKLNLWLHALEARQSLPDLDQNIKTGDSLLDTHLVEVTGQPELLHTEGTFPEQAIIWNRDFSTVMAKGGWDIIVGNPPYVRIQKLPQPEKGQYLDQFDLLHGNFDLSLAFVELAIKLLKKSGVVGFIIANSLIRANYASLIREKLVESEALLGILDFSDQRVFEGTGAYTCIVFFGNPGDPHPRIGVILRLSPCPAAQLMSWELEDAYNDSLVSGSIAISHLSSAPWVLVPDREYRLREKLSASGTPLEEIAKIFQGFKTGLDNAFVFKRTNTAEERELIDVLTSAGKVIPIERKACLPLVKGGDVERFHIRHFSHWILFPYRDGRLLQEEELNEYFPQALSYLRSIKDILGDRKEVKRGHVKWFAYSFAKSMTLYERPKIITPDIAPQASFAFDEEGIYAFTGGTAGGYGLLLLSDKVSYDFLLGLLNSQLVDWYVQAIAAQFHGGYFSYERRFIKDIPIFLPEEDTKVQSNIDDITTLTKTLKDKYSNSISLQPKDEREYREIAMILRKLENELNEAVMDLYGLNPDEKNLIRESPYWRKANLLRGS